MANWKFYIATFGCKVNQYESQLLRETWLDKGGEETPAPENADYILINSCAITARAERNARNAVFRLRRLAPYAKIILAGCAAQFYGDFRPRKNANFAAPDVCLPQKDKYLLLAGPEPGQNPDFRSGIKSYSRARPVIKIQDGCSANCSYCIVPQTRGGSKSRSRNEILAECVALARAGYGELVLSGVNLRCYRDHGDFWDLLAWLDGTLAQEFPGQLRLRISSLDPATLDSRAIEVLAAARLVCPHLHLSMQHASPKILEAMRRDSHTPAKISGFCEELARIWPVFGLGADIISGFPGETIADLELLLNFIEKTPLTYAHVFPYSRRQGTAAARAPGQIAKNEKEKRAWQIRALIAKKQKQFWSEQPAAMLVAADAPGENGEGRGVNEYYVPCLFNWPENSADYHKLLAAKFAGTDEDGIRVKIAANGD